MLASLKSLKCQSGTEKKKRPTQRKGGDEVHAVCAPRSPRSLNTSATKRISRWRMECSSRSHNELDATDSLSRLGSWREKTYLTKVTTVNLERDEGTLGITLRGGMPQNDQLSSPVVITHVKPGGPAAMTGAILPGDRLLAVNGISIQGSSLSEAQVLLKQPSPVIALTIEYDVKVMENVEQSEYPLLIEITRHDELEFGITLYENEDGVFIDHIKNGSIADRCGALREGDAILSVNNVRLDSPPLSIEEVYKLLDQQSNLRLEIYPVRLMIPMSDNRLWHEQGHSCARLTSGTSRSFINGGTSPSNSRTWYGRSAAALTHCETLHVTLCATNGTFGLDVCDTPDGSIVVACVHPDSVAESCGIIYPGDRILAINHRNVSLDKLTAKQASSLLTTSHGGKVSLHMEFDVLDTVVPASGIFTVKLAKHGCAGLGLTISAANDKGFVLWEVKRGSVAHRAGSLLPGDKLLEINTIPLAQCTAEQISHILCQGNGLITLKIERSQVEYKERRKVTCTVELQRCGGPIGITIAGSEEPQQPITVSGMTPGGLAEQAGVLQIGDEILAINNHCLEGEPLSTAHALLQTSPDLVTLKVLRNIHSHDTAIESVSPNLPSSIDSAVESWDSSYFDLSPSPEQNKATQGMGKSCTDSNFHPTSNKPSNYDGAQLLEKITNDNLDIQKQLDILSIQMDEQNTLSTRTQRRCNESSAQTETRMVAVHSSESSNTNTIEAPENQGDYVQMQNLAQEPVIQENGTVRGSCVEFDGSEMSNLQESRHWQCLNASQPSIRSEFQSDQLFKIQLMKDPVYEDFGFSVSDGLYERGVFVNRIRKGGPADLTNLLQPYDRILKVNETCTQDFDCCLTVPLIASAGESLNLLIARPLLTQQNNNRPFALYQYPDNQITPTITLIHTSDHMGKITV